MHFSYFLFKFIITLNVQKLIFIYDVVKFLRDMEYISSFNSIPVVFMQPLYAIQKTARPVPLPISTK